MLDGVLDIERNSVLETYREHEIFKFDSSDEIVSFSLGNDFNLMVSDKMLHHEVKWIENNYESNFNWLILFAFNRTEVILNNEKIHLEKYDSLIIQNENLINIKIDIDSLVLLSIIN